MVYLDIDHTKLLGWAILYTLDNVRESQKLLMVMSKSPGSLDFDSKSCEIDALHKYSGHT